MGRNIIIGYKNLAFDIFHHAPDAGTPIPVDLFFHKFPDRYVINILPVRRQEPSLGARFPLAFFKKPDIMIDGIGMEDGAEFLDNIALSRRSVGKKKRA
jgi:hypothetical protein